MAENVKKTDADYLKQFAKSPYGFRANHLTSVQGKSTLKGSWRRAVAKDTAQK